MLGSGAPDDVAYESERPVEVQSSETEDIDQAIEETEGEVEREDTYSDEDTGQATEEQEGQLTVDVFQDDQSIVIQSTIAGVSPDDLDVSITNDMVTIRGERRRSFDVDPADYF